MSQPKISIVVAARDIARYIDACLESLRAQSFEDIEVIVVDDGSVDETPERVQEFIRRSDESRFRLMSTSGNGPGGARNIGVAAAAGEFLSFVDGDDVVVPEFLEELHRALQIGSVDLAVCNAYRFRGEVRFPSVLHQKVFDSTPRTTNIRESPHLLYDMTVWNKLYRRDFWERNVGSFPVRGMNEDIIPSLKAHLAAGSVYLIHEPLYGWRRRESGPQSLTQMRASSEALDNRISVVNESLQLLGRVQPELLGAAQEKCLDFDLALHLERALQVDDCYLSRLAEAVRISFPRQWNQEFANLRVDRRLQYRLLAHGLFDDIRSLQAAWRAGRFQGRFVPAPKGDGFRLAMGQEVSAPAEQILLTTLASVQELTIRVRSAHKDRSGIRSNLILVTESPVRLAAGSFYDVVDGDGVVIHARVQVKERTENRSEYSVDGSRFGLTRRMDRIKGLVPRLEEPNLSVGRVGLIGVGMGRRHWMR
ncbi:MAG: glycosyltransferase family 2 protein [Nitriliruptoraceae bacterium]|nr:glycosyltransferase family 2 protein [Nitriliruptoraceae bacterium]